MRVALDVTPALAGSTGVARYTRELQNAVAVRGVEVRPFALGRGRGALPAGTRRWPVPLRVVHGLWRLTGWPRADALVAGGPIDLVHSVDLLLPPTRRPVVATMCDTTAVDRPDLHPARAVSLQRRRLDALEQAAVVLAISETTASALVSHGVERERITVTPLGLTGLPAPRPAPVPRGPFLLAVGALHRRKGLDVLLDAFAAFAPGQAELSLVIAGPDAGEEHALRLHADRLGLVGRVHFVGPVDDAQLSWLYREAVALCFPSRAEGFGLPVLEALGAGVAVVASDLPVLRELAGDAARYAPPGDTGALASAIAAVVGDEAVRADLARRGRERARHFTWEACAEATLAAYHRAAACG